MKVPDVYVRAAEHVTVEIIHEEHPRLPGHTVHLCIADDGELQSAWVTTTPAKAREIAAALVRLADEISPEG